MAPPRILVVDDQEPILFAVQDYLTAQGYQVDCARDVREANTLTVRAGYSAIIADLRLSGAGGMEGIEILEFVKKRSPSTVTVLLTAYRSPTVDAEARRCRVDAILDKPIPLEVLARAVAGLLGSPPAP